MPNDTLIVRKHYTALDGLRGIAILLVVWRHAVLLISHSSVAWEQSFYATFSILGSSGVVLFFVLSGFLITSILIDTSDDPKCLKKFYIRRSLRIFPLYYLATCILLIISSLYVADFVFNAGGWYHVFYIQNVVALFNDGGVLYKKESYIFFKHFWSLAVEEQFYLLWPVCFLFLYRRYSMRLCILLTLSLAIMSAIARYCMGMFYDDWYVPYAFTLTRLDGLLLGALLACVLCEYKKDALLLSEMAKLILPFLGGFILLLILMFYISGESISYVNTRYLIFFMAMFYTLLVAYVVFSEGGSWFKSLCETKFLTQIGTVSYGLYLFHWPIMIFVFHYFIKDQGWGNVSGHLFLIIVGGGLSFLLAFVSYYAFERPVLRLKDRLAAYTV